MTGPVPLEIRPEIGESWLRSVGAGILPESVVTDFDPERDVDGRLCRAAAPLMRSVRDDLPDECVILMVTDARGQIIDRWAQPRALEFFDALGGLPGVICDESTVGVTSVSGALRSRGTFVVRGREHFADALAELSCVAGPVTDPATGELMGTVSLSCSADGYHPVMSALVGRIAHGTRQRLLEGGTHSARTLHERFVEIRRKAKGPVAVLDSGTMFVNSAAANVLRSSDRHLLWEWALRELRGRRTSEGRIVLPSGTVAARCEAVHDGGVISGAVIRLSVAAEPGTGGGAEQPVWSQLTASERSVAEYVARGLTNRETAAALFVSPHTVDYHLRQVFGKLHIRSRVELARLLSADHA